jgi:hypothetical protein
MCKQYFSGKKPMSCNFVTVYVRNKMRKLLGRFKLQQGSLRKFKQDKRTKRNNQVSLKVRSVLPFKASQQLCSS